MVALDKRETDRELFLDGDNVLVVFCARFQFHDVAGIVAVTFELFGILRFLSVNACVNIAAGLLGTALEHSAVPLQLLPIISDDLAGSVAGIIIGDHQLHAERAGEKRKIGAFLIFFVVLQARARIQR